MQVTLKEMHRIFVEYSIDRLQTFQQRIDACLDKLNDEQVWWRGADAQNAVGNLVLHLSGNLTQWILESLGGDPPTRDRDAEFAARGGVSRDDLKQRLGSIVGRSAEVIRGLAEQRLTEKVTIQKYHVTVLEAVYHVVEHFALHAGQIMYATKLLRAEDLGFYSPKAESLHASSKP